MKKNLLITGGAGFVGSNLAIFLKKHLPDCRILCLDNLQRRGTRMNIARLKDHGISFIKGDVASGLTDSEKKKFNKPYTIVEGIDNKEIDMKELAKKLKSTLACGGTIKGGKIELQGEHKPKVKEILLRAGFSPDSIVVK